MKQNHRLTGRRIAAATAVAAVATCGGLALAPAAFADSTVASATTSSAAHSAIHSAVVHPDNANSCYQILIAYGYEVSVARGFACQVAATAPVNEAAKVASCVGLMKVAGVGIVVAATACTAATFPG
jgi:hypothetical protein